jgi:hypothetical protein
VYTPTCASWLNAIESHFTALKRFAINRTDDPRPEYRALAGCAVSDLAEPGEWAATGQPWPGSPRVNLVRR